MYDRDQMGEVVDGHTLRFVRVVKHPPERVWRAITDQRELTEWMRYPVKFEPRVGGRASWFGEDEQLSSRVDGKVFMFDPPRTLAFSFYDPRIPEQVEIGEREWGVRWDLAPHADGCRITFTQRNLPGAVLWGVGEGWHGFLDQLVAYLDGDLDAVVAEYARSEEAGPAGLSAYRAHVSLELRSWAEAAAREARDAVRDGRRDDALEQIDRVELAVRQLYRIARQPEATPDYSIEGARPTTL